MTACRKVAASASDISRKVSPGCQVPSAATMARSLAQPGVGGRARAEQQRLVVERVRLATVAARYAPGRRARETDSSRRPPARSTYPADGASARRGPRRRPAAPVLARTTAGRAARRRAAQCCWSGARSASSVSALSATRNVGAHQQLRPQPREGARGGAVGHGEASPPTAPGDRVLVLGSGRAVLRPVEKRTAPSIVVSASWRVGCRCPGTG